MYEDVYGSDGDEQPTCRQISPEEQYEALKSAVSRFQPGLDKYSTAMDAVSSAEIAHLPLEGEGAYAVLGRDIGRLVDEKNRAYGDSFNRAGDVLRILYPNGVSPDQYRDMLAVTRVIDKLFRIATAKEAYGESPWRDIAGYGILGAGGAP